MGARWIALACLCSLARIFAQQPSFLGSAACKSCHPAQSAAQASSAHARSLARVQEHPLFPSFGKAIAQRRPAVEWAFGGGSQAVTFVSRLDENRYLEHRLSYYASTGALAATPGHEEQKEPGTIYRTFAPDAAILRCFQCHSTGSLSVSDDGLIRPFEPGVRCETCHGPGARHVQAVGSKELDQARQAIVNPKRYSSAELNLLCGSCHRIPAAAGDDTNFRNAWNVRHQPLYLAESACFRKSQGVLSCLTCHDPHSGATKESCSNCHAKPRHPAAVRLGGRTCSSCHMPVVRPREELRFANHWIGVYRGDALSPK